MLSAPQRPVPGTDDSRDAGRWAPYWALAFVALWPLPGQAEAVLALGALLGAGGLLWGHWRGQGGGPGRRAGRLLAALFLVYWLPELVSLVNAVDPQRSAREVLLDLRYLPFLWLAAVAGSRTRLTFAGLALIVALWLADALIEALSGISPLYAMLEGLSGQLGGRPLCETGEATPGMRLSGVLGPCNPKLGLVLASLSPFLLYAAGRCWGGWGWLLAAAALAGVILLAGARAAWITLALVMAVSGWGLLGWRRLLLVFVLGGVALAGVGLASPQVRERLARTAQALEADEAGVDTALSGRMRIWRSALCMTAASPLTGVGVRGFRQAYPECDPHPGEPAAWGGGAATHAHHIVLEIVAETGIFGLLMWLGGGLMAWHVWRRASPPARERARPAMLALLATVFPFNTHLAFYSSFWGGLTLLLAALYLGSLLGREALTGGRGRGGAKAKA